MRIVTWNCYRGECRQRASKLDALRPDVTFLQECGQPAEPQDDRCVWFGNKPIQGVGVLGSRDWAVSAATQSSVVTDSAYPVVLSGPSTVHALGVWTQQRPTYVRSVMQALDEYRDFLRAAPSILVGDFNSHWRWDRSSSVNHSRMVQTLREEFGLESVYHAHCGSAPGEEEPTLYWQWKEHQPYHVDYCFVPSAWVPYVRAVSVGGYAEWASESDHRPMVVDIDDAALSS